MNFVVLMGRLVADPELRTTQSGVSVAHCRIAVDRRFKDASGNRQADFLDVSAWRQTAEFLQRYFRKGDPIVVQGSIQARNYEDKEGVQRKAVEIQADNLSFVLSKPQREGVYDRPAAPQQPPAGGGYTANQPAPSYANADASDFAEIEVDDDDLEGLPF
ncbi:MAG: single-stranded DNA-binding protein [Oscillospiraceae bacterium]|nr:single-stranded DNA-binding protein [Oscillospiraceae bacterium]